RADALGGRRGGRRRRSQDRDRSGEDGRDQPAPGGIRDRGQRAALGAARPRRRLPRAHARFMIGGEEMFGSIAAELMVLRKRAATWILLGLWAAMAGFFAYVLPYADYRGATGAERQQALTELLPEQMV